jgi:hypothetical protein
MEDLTVVPRRRMAGSRALSGADAGMASRPRVSSNGDVSEANGGW